MTTTKEYLEGLLRNNNFNTFERMKRKLKMEIDTDIIVNVINSDFNNVFEPRDVSNNIHGSGSSDIDPLNRRGPDAHEYKKALTALNKYTGEKNEDC